MSDSADEWMVLRQRGHGMAPWIALDWIGWDDFDPVLISNHLVEFNPLPKKTLRQNVENMQINPLFGVRFIETFFWNSPCPAEALKTIKTFWRNFWVPVNMAYWLDLLQHSWWCLFQIIIHEVSATPAVAPERIWKWGHTSGAKRQKKIVATLHFFLYKYTISRFGERFRDGQYILVSFLFAVLLLTVPPVLSHL